MPVVNDTIDEAILAELTANARISHAALGARVLLSRNAVRQRIERMERNGTIQGYTVVRAVPKGTSVVSATMFVDRIDRMRGADVIVALRSIPEVVQCDVLAGDLDLMVRIEACSLDRVRAVWSYIAGLPSVRDTLTSFTLSTEFNRASAS